MPQNSYSNKDLSRFERRPSRPEDMEILSETMRDDVPDYRNEPSVEALLAGARGSLDRANKLADETGSADIAQIPRRMNNLRGNAMPSLDPIDMLDAASNVPMAASVIPGPQQAVTGAMAGLMKTPKALRSLLQGNIGQGVAEGAEAAFVGAPGPIFSAIGKGARAIGGAAKSLIPQNPLAAQFPRVRGGRAATEIPYRNTAPATNPNQALAVARDIAFENGDDLAKVLSDRGRNPSAQALLRLAGSGAEGRGAAAVRAGQANNIAPVTDTVDLARTLNTEPGYQMPQLFADDIAGKGVYPLPNDARYMSEVDDLARSVGVDDLADMSLVDDVTEQVMPNARDVDMLVSGVTPQMEAKQAGTYAADPYKRRVPGRKGGKGKSKASLKALQNAIMPMADDVMNAGYQRAKE